MSGRGLSEAQRQLLLDLPGRVPVQRIERIWLFGPREIGARESGLLVLSLLPPPERAADQRQVVTWRYEAERVRGRMQRSDSLTEEGWAPAERIPRLIEGVLSRLRDETENPIAEAVHGSEARWRSLLESLGVQVVDPSGGE